MRWRADSERHRTRENGNADLCRVGRRRCALCLSRAGSHSLVHRENDAVWGSDWGANAILRFDPKTEKFESFPLSDYYASVRQLAGRRGESGVPNPGPISSSC